MAEKQKPGVMLYFDLRPCLQRLNNEQKGVLFSAIMDYAEHGIPPEIDDIAVGVAWDFVKPRIDRDNEAYMGKVEKARAAINKRWNIQTNTDVYDGIRTNTNVSVGNTDGYEAIPKIPTTTSTPTSTTTSNSSSNGDMALTAPTPAPDEPKAKRFVPPTLDEVMAYVQERGSHVDPERFVNYYQSQGWKVGRAPMKDWKAAVRNWEKREQVPGASHYAPPQQAARKSFSEIIAERTGTK